MTGYGMIAAGAAMSLAGYAMRVAAERQRFYRRLFGGLFPTYKDYWCNNLLTEGGAMFFALGFVTIFSGLLQLEAGR